MTEPTTRTTKADLLRMTQRALDALYRETPAPGAVPTGDTRGTVVVCPSTWLAGPLRAISRRLAWQGKVFNPATGMLVNKITPLRLRRIRAKVYIGESWLDGAPATIIDYSRTSIVARMVRDEVREVAPHLWLGKVFLWRWHAVDFLLED